MAKTNVVIAGDYEGKELVCGGGEVSIYLTWKKQVPIDRSTVESYELVDSQSSKSMSSGVLRGAVGAAVLGPIGAVAGAISAKNKGAHTLVVNFKDGKRSMIVANDKAYQNIMAKCF